MLANRGRLIGQITKLHGIHGEVILVSENTFSNELKKTEWVFLIIDGLPVPFRILESTLRSEDTAVLKIEGYNTPEESEELIGHDIYIEQKRRKSADKAAVDVHSIKDYLVIDRIRGKVGKASEVIDYDGNLVLQVWHEDIEILIPVDESIILGVDDDKREIFIDAPDGLLDLYL
jgi:16S rRNA processing protein RimM